MSLCLTFCVVMHSVVQVKRKYNGNYYFVVFVCDSKNGFEKTELYVKKFKALVQPLN